MLVCVGFFSDPLPPGLMKNTQKLFPHDFLFSSDATKLRRSLAVIVPHHIVDLGVQFSYIISNIIVMAFVHIPPNKVQLLELVGIYYPMRKSNIIVIVYQIIHQKQISLRLRILLVITIYVIVLFDWIYRNHYLIWNYFINKIIYV